MSSGATDFSGLEFLDGLDDEQREAALVLDDAVVSAGAGSGKTRVLTARYGAMIMSGRCGVEEILAITFTNKAANEMYRRIYSLLSRYAPSNEYARQAVESFHLARISTLDHFCAVTARTVCRRFGISPDFTSDEIRVRDLARSLALGFVLDKRDDPALRHLIAEKNIRSVTEELFVRPVLDHSPLSRPLDFAAFAELQRNEILERWNEHSRRADELTGMIRENYEWTAMENKNLSAALSLCRKAPDIRPLLEGGPDTEALRKQTGDYAAFLAAFRPVSIPKKKSETRTAAVMEAVEELKKLRAVIEALANNALQWNIQAGVFPLVEEYQELLHRKKKEAGILTFTDIAHLAVDGLRQYGDIRRMYQDSLKMIMIDEFQDNNSLQRDLVELLAGPASVFYVGDEKQSIYRFRGADVSVFRGLANRDGRRMRSLVLNRNYRSHPDLIAAFNRIFGGFRNGRDDDPAGGLFPVREAGLKKYEASYRRALAAPAHNSVTDDSRPRLHFAFFDKGSLIEGDPLRAADHEAFYVASQIRGIIDRSTPVKDKQSGVERPCRYGDVAVLERGRGSQRSLERALKQFGIPFGADRPAALFEDAPVNDLWALLKLLVYPEDRVAYGALLRSPLVRLGEEAFTLCMLRGG
ncbi:MAG: UvrD-helicase domain-containing protein, partial [Treponema sp.]|nr:UvrD-helicase domain-containing protein [Treponema sp.]